MKHTTKEEGVHVEKGEAVYEFVDKFAYFACAGNIVLECYTMTDGEEAYKKLMIAFDKYMQYYKKLISAVEQGAITQEVADTSINTYINWLQSKSMKSFVEKLQACLKDHNEDKIDIKSQMETIQTKMRTSKFTTSDLQKLLEHIRTMEEDNGE